MISARKALTATVFVLLCCALLDTRWTGWLSGPVYSIVNTVQYPAGLLVSTAKPQTQDKHADIPSDDLAQLKLQLRMAEKYNGELWDENRQLNEQINTYKIIAEIRTNIDTIRLVEAKVARFSDDRINPTMTLLRGSLQGIKKDDPVVYRFNMLGFVQEVGPATCTVSLVTKPSYRTAVTIKPPTQVRNEYNWPVLARAESDGRGAFISDVSHKVADALRLGDVVRISDRLRESANGFVLGTISEINNHPDRPLDLKRLIIQPNTPIGPQGMVTVLAERTD